MIIAVDFDGTCVTHEFPAMGRDIGAQAVLKKLTDAGHQLILWTMRSGDYLQQAIAWFEQNGIPLFGVNNNPEQSSWTVSPKAYAHLYIDDAALGAPLTRSAALDRPHIDWVNVEERLRIGRILKD